LRIRLVKKALMVLVAVAALGGTLTFVTAGSFKRGEQVTAADALPAFEILTTVRTMGINPISEPVRRGPYYVLQAYDARGIQVRVVADAQFGDILSIAPTNLPNSGYGPRYERGPRIIHVPQPDDVRARDNDRASVNPRDEPALSNDDDEDEVAPPPRRRVTPQQQRPSDPPSQRRSDAPPPPPPSQRRTVLSAPPPPAEGPTPVRPTPRFNSNAERADKFGSPRDLTVTPSTPPPGYTAPAALPYDDKANSQ
jgi:hypothetical protein